MKQLFLVCSFLLLGTASWSQKNSKNVLSTGDIQKVLAIPPKPIDPQIVQDQDDMTWDDYHPIPGKNWADPSLVPERKFRMALVAVDFNGYWMEQSRGRFGIIALDAYGPYRGRGYKKTV
jgi:hypothetical protein